ncbi:MAG: hypothetical protein PHD66_09150 [Eubacteriales bacterium]|nr:hypothetical protein [Eubacteriales bacterium]
MNMFNDVNGILGEVQTESRNQSLTVFFEQAKEVRIRLGRKAYLLDKYLSFLFETVNVKLARDAASDGFDIAGKLIGICSSIIRNEPMKSDHWFYGQAKKYIESHPLPFQEKHTQVYLYCVLLNAEFMHVEAAQYIAEVADESRAVLDICDLNELYTGICSLLDEEEPMEKLNRLFRQQFLITDVMTAFWQGVSNQLAYCLVFRDRETSKQGFQLLPDGGIGE